MLIEAANQFCLTMKARGGGVVDMTIRKIRRSNITEKDQSFWLVIHFHIDVCDAMGANCASTVAEGIAPSLQALAGGQIGFRIVSNMNPERCSKVFE
jgi:hydroxymethylglutaryl-CoA reductase